ncbi:efflux RND transporter periplasmic adaptor subunit [Acidobacteria bacterium AB60]|nr:efflux RND transporter periplasmic adaptor subunit [Acidobacteria bacterium AB60]
MAKQSKELNWRWVWLGAGIILVLVFFSVRSLTRDRLQVRAVQVTRESIESTRSTNGRVEPEENFEIHSPLATTVKRVFVQEGDRVTAGKVLLELDDIQARARVATAESALKSAQAGLDAVTHNGTLEQQQASTADVTRARLDRDSAQRDLNALVKLSANGAASAGEVAAARQRLDSANAALDASQITAKGRYSPADMARAQAAVNDAEVNLDAARDVESKTTVRAPIAGTVYNLDVKQTDFVEEGKLILQMADLHHERVRAYFDEPDIGLLSVGQPVLIKWDARLGQVWHGRIERVPITVTTYGTRNVGEVLVRIDDNDGQLLPATNVAVTVTTSTESNALSIPREALHVENGKAFVYRIVGDQLKRTPVTYGSQSLTQAAILSGLNAGDWVATGSISGQPLQQEVPVKVVK